MLQCFEPRIVERGVVEHVSSALHEQNSIILGISLTPQSIRRGLEEGLIRAAIRHAIVDGRNVEFSQQVKASHAYQTVALTKEFFLAQRKLEKTEFIVPCLDRNTHRT